MCSHIPQQQTSILACWGLGCFLQAASTSCFSLIFMHLHIHIHFSLYSLPTSLFPPLFLHLCPPFLPLLSSLPAYQSHPTVKLKGSSSACKPPPLRPHSTSTFTTLSGCLRMKRKKPNLADGRRLSNTGGILKREACERRVIWEPHCTLYAQIYHLIINSHCFLWRPSSPDRLCVHDDQ